MTKLDIVSSNNPLGSDHVSLQKSISLGRGKGSTLIMISNMPVDDPVAGPNITCNTNSGDRLSISCNGKFSSVGPSSVRDVRMLGKTDTATLCNAHTTGNIVVIAAGSKTNTPGNVNISCDNGFDVSSIVE